MQEKSLDQLHLMTHFAAMLVTQNN